MGRKWFSVNNEYDLNSCIKIRANSVNTTMPIVVFEQQIVSIKRKKIKINLDFHRLIVLFFGIGVFDLNQITLK